MEKEVGGRQGFGSGSLVLEILGQVTMRRPGQTEANAFQSKDKLHTNARTSIRSTIASCVGNEQMNHIHPILPCVCRTWIH